MKDYLTLEQMAQRRKLLNALRSKQYLQARHTMCEYSHTNQTYCYCVQGVALDVLPYGHWKNSTTDRKTFVSGYIPRTYEMCPEDYISYGEFHKLVTSIDSYGDEQVSASFEYTALSKAMNLNDNRGCDFNFLADFLEDQWFPQDGA